MTKRAETKNSRVNLRITPEAKKLIEMLALKEGEGVSEYLRNILMAVAQSSLDTKEFLKSVPEHERNNVIETLKNLIIENRDISTNSMKGAYEGIIDRFDKLERLISIFIYVYLYHTPEVIDVKKKQAKESAVERIKRTLALMDDKQMISTLSKLQSDEG